MLSVLPTAALAKRRGKSNAEMTPPPPSGAWRRVTLNIVHPPMRPSYAMSWRSADTTVKHRYFKPKATPGQADATAFFGSFRHHLLGNIRSASPRQHRLVSKSVAARSKRVCRPLQDQLEGFISIRSAGIA